VLLKEKNLELRQLDKAIHQYIPAGFAIRKSPHYFAERIDLNILRCAKHMKLDRAVLSIGTLGGGNHFIELSKDTDENLYLVVHSGSRHLGKQVAEYYQKEAVKYVRGKGIAIERSLAYISGGLLDDYLHDMAIIQHYADINRKAIVKELEKRVGFEILERFTTIHNYIDLDSRILRKGAISARSGEQVLIPMNMRDGSLICMGKGNEDWNQSAPHGAGRLMSRTAAKGQISLIQFEKAMEGIYSTTINRSTLDEAPFAYKPMQEIVDNMGETVDIVKALKPIYNFKAAE